MSNKKQMPPSSTVSLDEGSKEDVQDEKQKKEEKMKEELARLR